MNSSTAAESNFTVTDTGSHWFNHTDIYWKSNTARHRQSEKFLKVFMITFSHRKWRNQ